MKRNDRRGDRRPAAGRGRLRLALVMLMMATGITSASVRAAAPETPKPGTRYIYLVRHGYYVYEDSVDERTGNGLNELGHAQARLIGERLAGLPWRPGLFICSNYTRARETAADIGRVLDRTATEDTLLHECTPMAERTDWMKDSSEADIAACQANLEAAWRKYVVPSPAGDCCDLLVCHGNVIRWFVARALDVDTRKWSRMPIGNASLTVLAVAPDGSTRLVIFSDVGHLPLDRQSWGRPGARWAGREEK